ncbi:YdcF family protein [Anaeromicropila herbilytica]|uniref:DUF218 domain-containing protein n=1 Tax=Anaeromicropila herbilytica TaxID=2785025 RepID=A0A7R7IEX4_9FIRM|nr:YdcF family protein [Anaeromicropila herbilytica]BCN32496.1 hypothetical protein bsdtb5_37910 [Anaeromicropila herbilytica]
MNLFAWIFMLIGIVFIIYFAIIVIYTKAGTAFGGFFITVGSVCLILSYLYKYLEDKYKIIFRYIERITLLLFVIGILIFFIILSRIVCCAKRKVERKADYLIVLGARINGNTITKSLKYRLDVAVDYLNKNDSTVAIVSGGRGSGENISEAEAMNQYLLQQGIRTERIILEDRSTNTNENIIFSKNIIKDTHQRIVIVTNSFHLYRALQIAKKQGFHKLSGLGAPTDTVMVVSYYIREVLAVIKDKINGNM